MVRQSAVENALSVYLQNPYWKKVYDEAPSEESRRHCALDFYNGWYLGAKDGIAEQRRIEKNLTLEDWKYLLKYSGNNPFLKKCQENIERLQKGENYSQMCSDSADGSCETE